MYEKKAKIFPKIKVVNLPEKAQIFPEIKGVHLQKKKLKYSLRLKW